MADNPLSHSAIAHQHLAKMWLVRVWVFQEPGSQSEKSQPLAGRNLSEAAAPLKMSILNHF